MCQCSNSCAIKIKVIVVICLPLQDKHSYKELYMILDEGSLIFNYDPEKVHNMMLVI